VNRDRHLSDSGLSLLQAYEGLMLTAYSDSVGIPTIGYGHTRNVKIGDEITREQAIDLLREDVVYAENCINNEITQVRLSQHQFDALVSFVFNVGCSAFRNSTLLKKLRMGDFEAAQHEFGQWTRAGTDHPLGLIKRRAAEADWFGRRDE
jgi:lysozyme